MITLSVTPEKLDNLTWEQWELFDNASEKINYRKAREMLAVFVDDMDKDKAMEALGKLKTSEMKAVLEQFSDKMNELNTVNPPTRSG